MRHNADTKDHLHTRGEYDFDRQKMVPKLGSPPHTWRILYFQLIMMVVAGITSTYVENTVLEEPRCCRNRDHLHIRGEYEMSAINADKVQGSPPHTWRIPPVEGHHAIGTRITSTYVENTELEKLFAYRT